MQVIRKQYQNLSVHNVSHNCAISFSIIKALSQPKRLLISFFVQTFSIEKFFQLSPEFDEWRNSKNAADDTWWMYHFTLFNSDFNANSVCYVHAC